MLLFLLRIIVTLNVVSPNNFLTFTNISLISYLSFLIELYFPRIVICAYYAWTVYTLKIYIILVCYLY